MSLSLIFALFVIFILVFSLFFFITFKFINLSIDKRLARIKEQTINEGELRPSRNTAWLQQLINSLIRLSMPYGSWESSPLRLHFLKAGYRDELAVFFYYTAKTVLAVGLFLLALMYFIFFNPEYDALLSIFFSLIISTVGYYLPNFYVLYVISRRQDHIFETFPDALDLIRICVTSGLSLDGAISRVGGELRITSKVLSEEFHQLSMELRAGATRENALNNFANRTGVEDIQSLVAMLIQSGRFGTSVAEALRVHAEGLRSKRKLKAQEAAAKIPAKLSIPMILCIFPALFVVILGPSILGVMHMLAPIISRQT